MLSVTKKFTFASAHFLTNYEGACKKMHGHNYDLLVTFSLPMGKTELDKAGMIIDFSEIKTLWKEKIEPYFDHQNLNESLGFQPTAENMSVFLFNEFSYQLYEKYKEKLRVLVTKVILYETPTSFCEYTPYETIVTTVMADPNQLQFSLSTQNKKLQEHLVDNMTPELSKIYAERKIQVEKFVNEQQAILKKKYDEKLKKEGKGDLFDPTQATKVEPKPSEAPKKIEFKLSEEPKKEAHKSKEEPKLEAYKDSVAPGEGGTKKEEPKK